MTEGRCELTRQRPPLGHIIVAVSSLSRPEKCSCLAPDTEKTKITLQFPFLSLAWSSPTWGRIRRGHFLALDFWWCGGFHYLAAPAPDHGPAKNTARAH